MSYEAAEQIAHAYERMATVARHRPMAPGDGFGNITVPEEELDLRSEVRAYIEQRNAEEDALEFHIGCCDFPTRPATIYAVEAARALCATHETHALRLLRLAVQELEAQR